MENIFNRVYNRNTAYQLENNSKYSLILDTDMVFLKDPIFEFDHDIYMAHEGHYFYNTEKWRLLFSISDMQFIDSSNTGSIYLVSRTFK